MMATESPQPLSADIDAPMLDPSSQTNATEDNQTNRKRPRIDMAASAQRDRKRGRSMFGLVVGTLNKARNEEGDRNSSEAAKKRQMIEQRLQEKLRRETDSVRRAEEAKKDKTTANRREEELQLKDSIHKLRRTRLPILANFLVTSDVIPSDFSESRSPSHAEDNTDSQQNTEGNNGNAEEKTDSVLAGPPRMHPPPLYYLPVVLTPAQEAFMKRRKEKVKIAAEAEWSAFVSTRATGIAEISRLRERVAEEDARARAARKERGEAEPEGDTEPRQRGEESERERNGDVRMDMPQENGRVDGEGVESQGAEARMDVDEGANGASNGTGAENATGEKEKDGDRTQQESEKEKGGKQSAPVHVPMQADDDDAVEY